MRKNQTEIWNVDPDEAVLYRVISDDETEVLAIKGNSSMRRFRCVDESVLREWMP